MEKINLIDLKQNNKQLFKGELVELPLYLVKAKDLKFNPLNTRIHDVISTKFGDNLSDEVLFSNEVQAEIFKSLKDTHKDKVNQKLLKSISKGIIKPFVITEDGLVLSGNNRLGLIRASMGDKDSPFDDSYEVQTLLIKKNLTKKEILDWELSLQNETEIQKSYNEMGIALQVHKQMSEGSTKMELLKITSYKDEASIEKAKEVAELYYELLLFGKNPRKVDLFRDIKVYSYLDGLNNQLKKQSCSLDEKKEIKKLYFKTILSSTIPVQKMRDFLGKIIGDTQVPKEKRVELIKEFSDEIEPLISEAFQNNVKNGFEKDKLKMVDYASNENNIEETFENTTNEIKSKINFIKGLKNSGFKAVSKKLENSSKAINEINDDSIKTIFYFEPEEIEEMKQMLKKHKKAVLELEEILEGI